MTPRQRWMGISLALAAGGAALLVLAAMTSSERIAFAGAALAAVAYTAAIYAFYRSREAIPLRGGDVLTANRNPVAFRIWYAILAGMGVVAFLFFLTATVFGTV